MILDQCWVSRAARSRCHLITSPRTRVSLQLLRLWATANPHTGEKARISAAGGFVDFGRVNGNLALSRAIGDFEFKKSPELSPEQQIVTAYPDVTVHELTADDEFLVIACDGTTSPLNYGLPMLMTIQVSGTASPPKPWWSSCGEVSPRSRTFTRFART